MEHETKKTKSSVEPWVPPRQVEQILLEVEARCGVTFNAAVRIKLWKALRYQWFRGPGKGLPFIERVDVPQLYLPPLEWHEQDSKFKFSDLESDRQRQVVRKIKQLAPGETGQSLQTFQFEVYTRTLDLIYEYRDLERCVQEWERRNPRSMIQEDMREEVMRMRLKSCVDSANASIAVRRARAQRLKNFSSTLVVMQLVMFSLCIVMLFTAFAALNDTPAQLMLIFFLSSKQFLSAIIFFVASVVSGVVSERAKQDPLIRELKRTVLSCERLIERISDFRIATEELRLQKNEARKKGVPVGLNLNISAEGKKQDEEGDSYDDGNQVRQRPGKRKKKAQPKDEALNLWAPDAGKLDGPELNMMQKQLAQSFKRLGAMPSEMRPSGDRMRNFRERLGGVAEEDLCVQITSKQQKKRHAYVEQLKEEALAKLPKNRPPPALQLAASGLQGPPAQTLGRELRDAGGALLPLAPAPPPPAPPRSRLGGLHFHAPRATEENAPLLGGASSSQPKASAAAAASVSPHVPRHQDSSQP
ncbi:unnamed protein product [Effrenium voratum]|uniref:Uncharacterized protein n=1 Tax=Effrenium voratum TaxID=2562239 RepID=A0AA36MT08_9DINO|nr:unnamed protein product [Effrenium voratum]